MNDKMSTRRRALIWLLAAGSSLVVCLISCYVAARFFVGLNGGFGAGDIYAFVFYTIPFCLSILVLSFFSLVILTDLRSALRMLATLIIGASAGFLWTVINRWMLGLWFGAWSFPVLYCWIVGGAV